jgi:FkbM family methyltransferase
MKELKLLLSNLPKTSGMHKNIIAEQFGLYGLQQLNGVCIFGTGKMGKHILNCLKRVQVCVSMFLTNNSKEWGTFIDGIQVCSPNTIANLEQPIIVASKFVADIFEQLKSMNMKNVFPHYLLSYVFPEAVPSMFYKDGMEYILKGKVDIQSAFENLQDDESKKLFIDILKFRNSMNPLDLPKPEPNQYFPNGFWTLDENEIYIDVGAFDGDIFSIFLEACNQKFRKYYAFEPDLVNYKKLVSRIPHHFKDKVIAMRVGVGKTRFICRFASNGEVSVIDSNGADEIEIVPLDEICLQEPITSIKVDVEGFEPEVLKGAEKLIKKYTPKLAISAYHRPDHLWCLMHQIRAISTEYMFYLRHHEFEIYDTVLYAVPRKK